MFQKTYVHGITVNSQMAYLQCVITSRYYFILGNLLIPLLNGIGVCDPLGDNNVWGTLFQLTEGSLDDVILLTTKVCMIYMCV